jgi:hypothetical protein
LTVLRRRKRLLLMVIIPLAAVLAATAFYVSGGRYVSAEDAYVHAAKLMVSTDLSGIVSSVDVREGQAVKAGDCPVSSRPRAVSDRGRQRQSQSGADRAHHPRDETGPDVGPCHPGRIERA